MTPPNTSFTALGDEPFVSLTTFRKSGVGVPTTVWVGRDDDALIVLTPTESGKVKRIRNSGRVELVPSGRTGKVDAGATSVPGIAEIVSDPLETARLTALIKQKYGFEYRVTMLIERIAARRQKPRVIVRITAA